jgi:hypothetical protein
MTDRNDISRKKFPMIPCKITIIILVFLILGLSFIIGGIHEIYVKDNKRGDVFLILGVY